MVKNKKNLNKKFLIKIGIVIAVLVGIGIYIYLTKDSSVVANNVPASSSSIPAPPALPK